MKQIYVYLVAIICLTLSFDAQAQCNYQLELTDFFGNDWDSGANAAANTGVDVTIDGTTTTYLIVNPSTAPNTSVTEIYMIPVNNLSTISIDYRATSLPGDGEFRLIDSEGLLVYQTGIAEPSTMNIFTGNASCPTCPVVTNAVLSSATANDAVISWTNGGSETEWEVEYGISPYTPGNGGPIDPATSNPWTINGLSSVTTYDVYVRAVCVTGTDISNSVGPITFTTAESCPAPSNFAPITQSAFEIQFTWDANGNTSANYEVNYDVSPFTQSPGSGQFETGNFGNFALVDNLMSATTYDFYVRYDCGMGDFSLWQGPYTATTAISCPEVTGLQADAITDSSLDVSWSAGGAETAWEVEYAPVGTITIPFSTPAQGFSSNVTAPSISIAGLTDATVYDVFVRAVCDPALPDYSAPTQLTVTTLCLAFTPTSSAPYLQDFESFPAAFGFTEELCWTGAAVDTYDWNLDDNGGTPSSGTGPNAAFSGTNYFYTEASGGTTGTSIATLTGPQFDLSGLTNPSVQFYYHMFGGQIGDLILEVDDSTGSGWTAVNTISGAQQAAQGDAWLLQIVNLGAYAGQTVQIRFRAISGGSFEGDIALDDFSVGELPACPDTNLLATDAILDSTAILSWSENGLATSWEVEVQPTGVAQGTAVAAYENLTATNPETATGLTPETTYDYYVRSNCGVDGFSTWVGPFTFTTKCAALVAPYTENFDAFTVGLDFTAENCWEGSWNSTSFTEWNWNVDGAGSTPTGNTGPDAANSGVNYLYVEGNGGAAGNEAVLLAPIVDITGLTAPSMLFASHMFGTTTGILHIDVNDGTGFVNDVLILTGQQQTSGAAPWEIQVVDLLPYNGTGTVQVRFRAERTETGFSGTSDISIDDVVFDEIPSCPAPTQLALGAIAATSVDFTWTNNSTATEFLVEYRETGSTVFTAVTPNPTTSNTTISGLNSSTEYEICVTSICDSATNDTSTPSCTVFTTTQDYCSGDLFVDSGGVNGDYQNNENITYNLCPDNAGDVVFVNFTFNDMEDSGAGCFDGLTIYDGPDTTFPTINTPSGGTEWCWDPANNSGTGDLTQELLIGTTTSGCITIVFSSDGSVQRPGWSASVTCSTPPTCDSPDMLALDATTSTTADVSWTAGDIETEWDVEVGLSGFVPNTGAQIGTVIDVLTNPLTTLSGLTANTEYDYWVRAVCAPGDESIYIGPFTFTTRCVAITAPYFTNYDSDPLGGLNNCDSNIEVGSGTGTAPVVTVDDLISNSGGQHIYMYSGSSTAANAELYYILPEFSDLDATKRVRFFAYDRDLGGLEVGTMTDPTDATTFTVVQAFTNADLPDDQYVEQTVNFSSLTTTGGWIAFRFIPAGTFDAMYLDDVNYEEIPSCPQPSLVTSANPTETSVELSWVVGGAETEWNVEYGTPGFTPGGAGSLGTRTSVLNNTSYVLDMLSANTLYEIRVFAVCAPMDISPSSNPITVITSPSAPQGVSCPNNDAAFAWEDDFETIATNWTGDVGTGTTGGDWNFGRNGTTVSTATGPSGAEVGSGYLFFETSGTNTTPAVIVSPAIDLSLATDEAELSFYLHSFGGDATILEVAVGTSPTGPFTNVFTYVGQLQNAESDPFILVGASLPSSVLGNATVYIQVTGTEEQGNETGFVGDVAIDLMRIETCGDFCSNPDSFAVANLGPNGGDFSFNDTLGTPAGSYEYVLQPDGTGVPTVAGTALSTTSFTDNTLMSATSYEVYYRTVCGPTNTSDWVGPFQFITTCLPFTAPYFTDYETDPLDGLFICDNAVFENVTGTNLPLVEVEDFIANSGSRHIYLYSGNDAAAGIYYVMPEFSDLDATKRVRFFAYDRDLGGLEVGVMSDPNDFTTFTVVQTFTDADLPDDSYAEQTVNFTSLTTTGGHIAFRFVQAGTFDAMYLDDINYEVIPSCPNPTGLTVNVVGDDNLDLSWNAGNTETEWIVEYAAPDFATGTATPVTGVLSNTNYILSGLTPNTSYQVRVFAVCNPMDTSPAANAIRVRTFPLGPQGVSCTTGAPGFVWEDSFDTIATTWTGDVGTGTTNGDWNFGRAIAPTSTNTGPNGPFDGNGFLYFETTGTNIGPARIVSPPIDLTTGANDELELSFYIHSFGGDQTIFDVAYGTSAAGPFTSVFTYVGQLQTAETDGFAPLGAMLPSSLIGQTIYIQISGTEEVGNETGFVGDFAVDLMRIQTCGTFCATPSGVTLSAISSDSVIVDWTENGNATTWEVAVVPTGNGIPAGNGTSTTNNPYTASGLTSATFYEVYVRADCGGGFFSDWTVLQTFSTACSVITQYPYVTDFTTNVPNQCWDEAGSGEIVDGPLTRGASDWRENRSYENVSGTVVPSNAINLWQNVDREWLLSEIYDMTGTSNDLLTVEVAVTDYLFTGGSTSNNPDVMGSDDQVDLLITTDSGVTWTSLTTWNAANQPATDGTSLSIDLSSYSGVVQFAFLGSDGTIDDTEDYDFHIGSFVIDGTAGNNDMDSFEFNYYPSPTNNLVNFSGQQVIDGITVRNLLGQQLLVTKPNATSTNIDLSSFPSGLYLIEVASGEQSRVVKVLRN